MDIKILGMGCPSCRRLEANVREALAGLNGDAEVEKVTDLRKILGYGVSTTPALVVDGRVVFAGQVPAAEQIRGLLAGT